MIKPLMNQSSTKIFATRLVPITIFYRFLLRVILYLINLNQVGLIAISPVDQQIRIKIYKDENGLCKGDASLCYNAETSVAMAIDYLSGGYIRPSHQITVSKAEFKNKGNSESDGRNKKPKMSNAQYKVAQSVMKNALAWGEDDGNYFVLHESLYFYISVY